MDDKTLLERILGRVNKSESVKESIQSFLSGGTNTPPVVQNAQQQAQWDAAWTNTSKGIGKMIDGNVKKQIKTTLPKTTDISNDSIVKAIFASVLSLKAVIPMFVKAEQQMAPPVVPATESVDATIDIPNYIWRSSAPVARKQSVVSIVEHGSYKFNLTEAAEQRVLARAPGKYSRLFIDRTNFEVYTEFKQGVFVAPTKSLPYGKVTQSGKLSAAAGNSSMAVRKVLEYSQLLTDPVITQTVAAIKGSLGAHISADVMSFIMSTPALKSVLADCVTLGVLDAMNINQEPGVRPWPAAESLRSTMFDGTMRTLYSTEVPKQWPPEVQRFRDTLLTNVMNLVPMYDARPGLSQDIQLAMKLAKNTDLGKVFASSSTLMHQMFGIINHGIANSGIGEQQTQELIDKLEDGWDGMFMPDIDPSLYASFGQKVTTNGTIQVSKLDLALNGGGGLPTDPDMKKYGFVLAYFTSDENYAIKLQYAPHYFAGTRTSTTYAPTRHKSSMAPGITVGAAQYITHLASEAKARTGDVSPVSAEDYLAAAKQIETGSASSSYRASKEGALYTQMVRTFYRDGKFDIPTDSRAILMVTVPSILQVTTEATPVKIPSPEALLGKSPSEWMQEYFGGTPNLPDHGRLETIHEFSRRILEPILRNAEPTLQSMEGKGASVRDAITMVRNHVVACLTSGLWTCDPVVAAYNNRTRMTMGHIKTSSASSELLFHAPYTLYNAFEWPTTKEDTDIRGSVAAGVLDSDITTNIAAMSRYHHNAMYNYGDPNGVFGF